MLILQINIKINTLLQNTNRHICSNTNDISFFKHLNTLNTFMYKNSKKDVPVDIDKYVHISQPFLLKNNMHTFLMIIYVNIDTIKIQIIIIDKAGWGYK